ncbi:MAG: class I SAM-dependent RNA methyltransferase [Vicinamibacterales bacterium]
MASVGQILHLQIEKPAAGGRMIARAEGAVVFVAGAIPGERVAARVTRVARGVVFADTVSVDQASPDRRDPFCDGACGGTVYAHIAYDRQLAIKAEVVADGLQRIGRLAPPSPIQVAGSVAEGYRLRARLHVQGGRVGFFREGSHQLCDPRPTRQLLPDTCDVLERIAAVLGDGGDSHVRELDVSENIAATTRAVHLDVDGGLSEARVEAVSRVPGLTGLTLTSRAVPDTPPRTRLISGDPYVYDRLEIGTAEVVLRRHVQSFFQANRYLVRAFVTHVSTLVPAGQRVVDLYAGVGLFAVSLGRVGAASVVAVEGDPIAARDLEINASAVPGVTVHHEPVERFLERRPAVPEVVVLDPPRTGLSAEALRGLLTLRAPRLVYVSCDIATFARDARALAAAGYRLDRIDGFDLFPNTPHVETVAAFGLDEASGSGPSAPR